MRARERERQDDKEREREREGERMADYEAYPMVGGDDAYSYAKNSGHQRAIVNAAKELIHESIPENLLKILEFDTSNTVKIADLGCSVGPNTFFAMQNIIEAVEHKLLQAKNQAPLSLEFQVFFNDHYQNDFNTLFKNLPSSRKYFVSATPGSFHGRLFPKSSLHFAHISTALHWLSKVPKEIMDRNSPAWNKGSRQCTRSTNQEAIRAYSTQFKNDVEAFLNARAEEIVPGGLMFILAILVPDGIPISNTYASDLFEIFGSCLNDMVKMGMLSEEKVDSFNLPIYHATPEELKAIFKTNENFSIEKMEKLSEPMREIPLSPAYLASSLRAGMDGLIRNHFGNEVVDQIFNYFTTKLEEDFSKIQSSRQSYVIFFILLKRIG